ncbi:MAG TPA: PQQ-binding-like beta-propeller repeat protein [Methylomirabilota bacterium]
MTAAGIVSSVVVAVVVFALRASAQTGPTQAELDSAAANATDWLHPNHDYAGQRFVDVTQINRQNAASLEPVCRYDVGDLYPFQTNPIVYRGVIYLTTPYATLAVDAATCRLRWRHDWIAKARENWPQNRGIAIKAGRVIRGTRDGYLFSLDAETGRLLWERAAANAADGETLTMPPLVFDDLVIVGPAGNEVPIKGWVGAFKIENGEPVWRFHMYPRPGEAGAESWGTSDALTGGGAVWTPFALDHAAGLVFIPVGNPAPDFYGDVRPGANLYTNSLVVLDARTGTLAWHYQATPHDTHDWDLTQVSPLFTADVNGTQRRLVAVAGKDGLLHVLDRKTGDHLYEVAVTRRENVDLPITTEGVHVCPGPIGGVQWNGPAFSPRTNTLYVPSVEWCATFRKAAELRHFSGGLYMGGTSQLDRADDSRGWLTAIDASTGRIRWRYQSRRPMVAAVTVTAADILFTGELGGDFLVLDAADGTVLYRFDTGAAMSGGIVTYRLGERQYVAVTAGNANRFWAAPARSATMIIFAVPAPSCDGAC